VPPAALHISRGGDGLARSVDGNRLGRTNVDAGTAVAAGVFIDHGLAVLHLDRVQGASVYAITAPGAGFFVHNRGHQNSSYVSVDPKVQTAGKPGPSSQPMSTNSLYAVPGRRAMPQSCRPHHPALGFGVGGTFQKKSSTPGRGRDQRAASGCASPETTRRSRRKPNSVACARTFSSRFFAVVSGQPGRAPQTSGRSAKPVAFGRRSCKLRVLRTLRPTQRGEVWAFRSLNRPASSK